MMVMMIFNAMIRNAVIQKKLWWWWVWLVCVGCAMRLLLQCIVMCSIVKLTIMSCLLTFREFCLDFVSQHFLSTFSCDVLCRSIAKTLYFDASCLIDAMRVTWCVSSYLDYEKQYNYASAVISTNKSQTSLMYPPKQNNKNNTTYVYVNQLIWTAN